MRSSAGEDRAGRGAHRARHRRRPRHVRIGVSLAVGALLSAGGCGSNGSGAAPETPAGSPTTSDASEGGPQRPALPPPTTPIRSYVDNAVGFGESLATAYGTHRVLAVHDPATDITLRMPAGTHAVRVPIEECVNAGHPAATVSAKGWSMTVAGSTAHIAPALPLLAATDGSPPVSASGRVRPGQCAIGDLVFVVRNRSVVEGLRYVGAGAQDGTWADVGR